MGFGFSAPPRPCWDPGDAVFLAGVFDKSLPKSINSSTVTAPARFMVENQQTWDLPTGCAEALVPGGAVMLPSELLAMLPALASAREYRDVVWLR